MQHRMQAQSDRADGVGSNELNDDGEHDAEGDGDIN